MRVLNSMQTQMKLQMQIRMLIAAALAAMLLLGSGATAAEAATTGERVRAATVDFEIIMDGQTLRLPAQQYLFVVKGTSYVPVRFMSYMLQKQVTWDQASRTVHVSEPTAQERVRLQEYLLNLRAPAGTKATEPGQLFQLTPIAAQFTFDGEAQPLPAGQQSFILNGSVYVPVRFMSEAIGVNINWSQQQRRISASTSGAGVGAGGGAGTGTGSGDSATDGSAGEGEAGNGGAGTGGGVGGGTPSVPATYASITANAQSQLAALESSCRANLTAIANDYLLSRVTVDQAVSRAEAEIASCDSRFEQILTQTEAQLTAGGFSTDVLADYRTYYEEEKAKGRGLLDILL